MKRKASAVWQGGLRDGKGRRSTGCPVSRLLNAKITMDARLEAQAEKAALPG